MAGGSRGSEAGQELPIQQVTITVAMLFAVQTLHLCQSLCSQSRSHHNFFVGVSTAHSLQLGCRLRLYAWLVCVVASCLPAYLFHVPCCTALAQPCTTASYSNASEDTVPIYCCRVFAQDNEHVFKSTVDSPGVSFLPELVQQNPHAKVILSVRDSPEVR